MKKILSALLALTFLASSGDALALSSDVKYRLNNQMGAVARKVQLGTMLDLSGDASLADSGALTIASDSVEEDMLADVGSDGLHALRIARATYDVSGPDDGSVGAHGLGVSLPANAHLLKSWFYVETQFVDSGAGTVALHCEDANNIFSAADITGNSDGTEVAGASDWAVGNMVAGIAAACEITATVAGAEQTAGKLIVWVIYAVLD